MASRSLILAVLLVGALAVSVGAHDPADHAKIRADEAQAKVVEGAAAAGDSAKTWTEAAKERVNTLAAEAKGKVGETVEAAKDYAYDTVGIAKDTTGAAKDASYENVGAAKVKTAEGAAAAQDSAQSYLDMAKEKLNIFSKYVFSIFQDALYFSSNFHFSECVVGIVCHFNIADMAMVGLN